MTLKHSMTVVLGGLLVAGLSQVPGNAQAA